MKNLNARNSYNYLLELKDRQLQKLQDELQDLRDTKTNLEALLLERDTIIEKQQELLEQLNPQNCGIVELDKNEVNLINELINEINQG